MKNLSTIILRAVALATGIATIVLGLMQSITMSQGILLLALGQTCLALSLIEGAFGKPKKED